VSETVNVDNFTRAETARMFDGILAQSGGINRWLHLRGPVPLDQQTVIRMNRDTLYSSAVVDISEGAVLEIPDVGDRYLSVMVVDEDHYDNAVLRDPGRHELSVERHGTRFVNLSARIFVDPDDPDDVAAVNALQDALVIDATAAGPYEHVDYDTGSLDHTRGLLLQLMEGIPDSRGLFGPAAEVDPVRHLIGTAAGWGGLPESEAFYTIESEPCPAGHYLIVFRDVPVDAFWSISVHNRDGFFDSYCNTVPTPDGGTHESGLRAALTKGLRGYGELIANKKAAQINADDVLGTVAGLLSVFIREPEFQGQTKDRLATAEAQRIVESSLRDPFDHWLADRPQQATRLLEWVIERSEERLRRKREKEVSRKNATRKLRLPGKLADCSRQSADGTEIFLVEGDSAGGSAKQARARETQAILPLRGKILNVANASAAKLSQNQLIGDLGQALGCGTGGRYREDDLRYERVIIMTDADVDGAHIASLLITFFYSQMRPLIEQGHLYLAVPPLYKLRQGTATHYALDEVERDQLLEHGFSGRGKIEVSRFKGLGEMNADELKATTMNPNKRRLLRVEVADDGGSTDRSVNDLMGNKPEARFRFIQDRAAFAEVDELDV